MNTRKDDIISIISEFKSKSDPTDSNASFDYCYKYFRTTTNSDLITKMEQSCLTLGFYLASWGMLRGSSFLLKKSSKYYQKTIEYISTLDRKIWDIDVDTYNEVIIDQVINIYQQIKERIIEDRNSHLILTTKILLGVFGFIPAYDQYFGNTMRDIYNGDCGFRSVNKNSLNCIKDFYEMNKKTIDKLARETFVTDFDTEGKTELNYPKAKIIDMYGFTKGLK